MHRCEYKYYVHEPITVSVPAMTEGGTSTRQREDGELKAHGLGDQNGLGRHRREALWKNWE